MRSKHHNRFGERTKDYIINHLTKIWNIFLDYFKINFTRQLNVNIDLPRPSMRSKERANELSSPSFLPLRQLKWVCLRLVSLATSMKEAPPISLTTPIHFCLTSWRSRFYENSNKKHTVSVANNKQAYCFYGNNKRAYHFYGNNKKTPFLTETNSTDLQNTHCSYTTK